MIESIKSTRVPTVVAMAVGGLLVACAVLLLAVLINDSSETAATATKAGPAKVEAIEGSEFKKVTLTEKAAERVGIATAPVADAEAVREGSAGTLTVPYSTVVYDAKGNAFVYTNPEPLVFLRAAITVDYVAGDLAVLTAGPAAGTSVVTVGAAELLGAETGIGK